LRVEGLGLGSRRTSETYNALRTYELSRSLSHTHTHIHTHRCIHALTRVPAADLISHVRLAGVEVEDKEEITLLRDNHLVALVLERHVLVRTLIRIESLGFRVWGLGFGVTGIPPRAQGESFLPVRACQTLNPKPLIYTSCMKEKASSSPCMAASKLLRCM
jgi:hypothetical protein